MIETDRLRLRKFEEKDLSSILKIYGNPQINRFLPWFPLKNMEEAKAFLEKEKTKKLSFAICLKEDDIPIGYIKVSEDDSHDLGYGLLPEYQKKGIMTEAGKALIQYLQSLFIPFITATHDKNNPKSGNVMKRLNMKYLYSYVEMWEPKHFEVTFQLYILNLDGKENRKFDLCWNKYPNHFIEDN